MAGEMLWSQRITKKLSCPQTEGSELTCSMELESYGYTAEEIFYALREGEKSFLFGIYCIQQNNMIHYLLYVNKV